MKRILDYTRDNAFEDFIADPMLIDAVVRNFEIIGEAANNLPNTIKEQYSTVTWQKMYL